MKDKSHGRRKGVSLAKGPVALIGLALLAYGILALLFGDRSFTASPIDGNVTGEPFLGLAGNGWTNVLIAGAGALLLFGSPLHWGAKSMAIIVGLVLGAASVISMVDGSDVFGIFATNGPMQLALGIAAAALLILSLLPRVGKKDKHRDRDMDIDRDRDTHVHREREVVRERPVRTRETMTDRVDDRDERFRREPVREETHVGHGMHREEEHLGRGTHREVVAPADGDGPEDRGRETFDRRDRI